MFRKRIHELEQELEITKQDLEYWKKRYQDLSDTLPDLEKKTKECTEHLEEIIKLKKEIEVYKEYYDVNSGPSDEIREKVFTNIKVRELKEENLKLMSIIAISTGMKSSCCPSSLFCN